MILFWFVIGMLAIIAIARYNEDDRLFWKLTLSFVFAFTATTVALKVFGGKQEKENLTEQVCPMQAPSNLPTTDMLVAMNTSATVSDVTDPVPAGKDTALIAREIDSDLGEIYGWSRDQPPRVLNVNGKFYPLLRAFGIDSS